MPVEIEKLEQEICDIEQQLSDADLYNSNAQKFAELTDLHAQKIATKEEKELNWIELQIIAEELDA